MDITHELAAFLLSESFAAVRTAYGVFFEKYRDSLRIQMQIRAAFPSLAPQLLAAVADQWSLADKGADKTGLPHDGLYTRIGIEQASSSVTAHFHSTLFAGVGHMHEWCAGLGSDTRAFALLGGHVCAVEADEVTAHFLAKNMELCGFGNVDAVYRTAESDYKLHEFASAEALFADPSRRIHGRRVVDAEAMSPPLSLCRQVAARIPVVVKAAPAADVTDTFWKRAFVAVGNECREQLLVHGFELPVCCAVDAETGERWVPPDRVPDVTAEIARYIIEPHNAVIRTGSARLYFATQGAAPVDPRIAYGLSTEKPAASRWHETFEILERMPFQRRRVQEAIHHLGFGPATEIKKRGTRMLPEDFSARFKFRGSNKGVILLARVEDEMEVFFARRVSDLEAGASAHTKPHES